MQTQQRYVLFCSCHNASSDGMAPTCLPSACIGGTSFSDSCITWLCIAGLACSVLVCARREEEGTAAGHLQQPEQVSLNVHISLFLHAPVSLNSTPHTLSFGARGRSQQAASVVRFGAAAGEGEAIGGLYILAGGSGGGARVSSGKSGVVDGIRLSDQSTSPFMSVGRSGLREGL